MIGISEKIVQNAYRLLHPNDTLDLRLFDVRQQLYPDVKDILLGNAMYIVRQTVGKIGGLEVTDICMNGSSASYFYHEKSDIDMKIVVNNESCDFLTKDELLFHRFLCSSFSGRLNGFKFQMHGRFVDTKVDCSHREIVGLYSILNDKWIVAPDKHIIEGLSVDELLEAYRQKYTQTVAYLDRIEKDGTLKTAQGIKDLRDFYTNEIIGNNESIKVYFVFKLLVYSGVFQRIKKMIGEAIKNYLSIKPEDGEIVPEKLPRL